MSGGAFVYLFVCLFLFVCGLVFTCVSLTPCVCVRMRNWECVCVSVCLVVCTCMRVCAPVILVQEKINEASSQKDEIKDLISRCVALEDERRIL